MRRPKLALLALCAAAVIAGCGDDDDDGGASAADLKAQLTSESQIPGFKVERSFEWDNEVDAVTQGVILPEETPPSTGVDLYEENGFEAGAGQGLAVSKGNTFEGPHALVAVFEFAGEEEAGNARDFLHEEELKQPCFAVCSVQPSEVAVDGIPGAKGAKLLPLKNPPPNAPPPFEAYAVEFTVDSRVYALNAGGGPGQVKQDTILDAARQLYARVKNTD